MCRIERDSTNATVADGGSAGHRVSREVAGGGPLAHLQAEFLEFFAGKLVDGNGGFVRIVNNAGGLVGDDHIVAKGVHHAVIELRVGVHRDDIIAFAQLCELRKIGIQIVEGLNGAGIKAGGVQQIGVETDAGLADINLL